MRIQPSGPTAVSLLAATALALGMSMALAQAAMPMSLGIGLVAAILIVAVASNELALYLLILSMLLGPQVLVGELGKGATLGRGLSLRLDDLLLFFVGVAWLAKTAVFKELGLVFRTPLNRPIAAYACAALFATGLGIMEGRVQLLGGAFFVMKYIQYFVIYFIVVNNLHTRRQFERFLTALLLTAAVASFFGILQIPSGQRVYALFEGSPGEPNTFGGYLVLMLALTAALYLTSDSPSRKLVFASLAGLIILPLVFTLSRSSYLALIALSLALLAWSERRRVVVAVLAVFMALAVFAVPASVVERVQSTFTEPFDPEQVHLAGVRLDLSTSDRLHAWSEIVLQDWPKHPVFGFGVTGYRFVDAQYVRVLAETGLIGLLAFLWLQVSLFRQAHRILKEARDPLFKGVALGFLVGFTALITHALGANTFIIVRIMEPFWFLAAMLMMIPQLQAAEAPDRGRLARAGLAGQAAPSRMLAARRWEASA